MAQPWFDPRRLPDAEVDGELAGFCWLKIEDRPNEAASARSTSSARTGAPRPRPRALLLVAPASATCASAASMSPRSTSMSRTPRAVDLYEASGFHHHHVDVCYSRPLGAGEHDRSRRVEAAALSVCHGPASIGISLAGRGIVYDRGMATCHCSPKRQPRPTFSMRVVATRAARRSARQVGRALLVSEGRHAGLHHRGLRDPRQLGS